MTRLHLRNIRTVTFLVYNIRDNILFMAGWFFHVLSSTEP